MSTVPNSAVPSDHRLSLSELMDALVATGEIDGAAAEKFKQDRRYFKGDVHPLINIAQQRWKSLKPPHRLLDLDALTLWLADWSGMTYFHIDPLKINFSAVTDVMSSA